MPEATVLGSGKMALDIGGRLLAHGYAVTWVTGDPARVAAIERHAGRTVRRLKRIDPACAETCRYRAAVAGTDPLPPAQLILESTVEDLAAKQRRIEAAVPRLSEASLLVSNSSSLLPSQIHPRCLGMHFFYPVQLTGAVEIVVPDAFPEALERAALDVAAKLELVVVRQSEETAFLANRLLMPLQNECVRAMNSGIPPGVVDACSRITEDMPGQLALIDSVGPGTVAASVSNYLDRMAGSERQAYAPLVEALSRGEPLLGDSPQTPGPDDSLRRRLAAVYLNSCLRASESGRVPRGDIDTIVSLMHGTSRTLDALLVDFTRDDVRQTLAELNDRDARSYFQPSTELG